MISFIAFISGLIFSVGLVLSGMTNPDKVIGFLDIFGRWDYALAFVMGGAVVFNFFAYKFVLKRKEPLLCDRFSLPSKKAIDRRIVVGAILFGIGWGLIGMCPGPAIVNLVLLDGKVILFVLSMSLGMNIFKLLDKRFQ